jgi:hypothetical protein
VYIGLGFGHAASFERSELGATLVIRGPRGTPPTVIEIIVTEEGATVRLPAQGPPSSGSRVIGTLLPDPSGGGWPAASFADPPSVPPPLPVSTLLRAPSYAPAPPLPVEPQLSVQQYASLRAECMAARPDMLSGLLAQYGLDEATDTVEADAWRRRFAQDAPLFATYKRLFQQFRKSPSSAERRLPETPTRILSLGEYATMSAELTTSPPEEVYARYGLADSRVRAEVLARSEAHLKDPVEFEKWSKLRELAQNTQQPSRK